MGKAVEVAKAIEKGIDGRTDLKLESWRDVVGGKGRRRRRADGCI